MISDFDPSRSVCDQLNGYDRSVKADAFAQHYLSVTRELEAASQSHRERSPRFAAQAQLSVQDVTEVCDLADE
jgi:hypothetical protein